MQVVVHCFTISETTQTFTKMLTSLILEHYIKHGGLMLALIKVWVVSALVKQWPAMHHLQY